MTTTAGRPSPPDTAGSRPPWPSFYPRGAAPPPGVDPVDVATLPPLTRALLGIDGTVTTFLEAIAGEPVAVVPRRQQALQLAAAEPDLAAPAGTAALARSVCLAGERSGRVYALADSLILPGRLPPGVRAALESGAIGIGQALRAPGFDSRRDGLWFGRVRRAPGADVAPQVGDEFLVRCYCVQGGGAPVMRITEFFPWAFAVAPSGAGGG